MKQRLMLVAILLFSSGAYSQQKVVSCFDSYSFRGDPMAKDLCDLGCQMASDPLDKVICNEVSSSSSKWTIVAMSSVEKPPATGGGLPGSTCLCKGSKYVLTSKGKSKK